MDMESLRPEGYEDTAGISGHASQEAVYGVTVAFTLVMGLIVIARMFTRAFIAKQTGADDALISVAAVFSLVYCIGTYRQAMMGMGLHVWDPAIDMERMSIYFWTALWSYYTALGFTKLSILMQYLRIFPQIQFRRACYVMLGVTILWTLWAVFSSMIMCVPVSVFWTTDDFFHDPHCLPRLETWYANAGVNMLSDFVTALLPIGVIRGLEIPKRQKQLLYVVFCVGLITCVLSALRLIWIYPMTQNADQSWHSPMFSIWSCVELNVAILCSCAPTLKGLIQRVWPQFLASIGSRYGSRGSGKGSSGSGPSGASGSTAVNSTNISTSTDSIRKPQDISHVESQTPEKSTSSGFLGFRRSLFKPFSKNTNSSLSNCYGNTKNDEDVLFDDDGSQKTRQASSSSGLPEEKDGIEVQTIVDQRVEPREARPAAPRSEEVTKTMVSGAGPMTIDPFKDDQQDERDIQKAAWSS